MYFLLVGGFFEPRFHFSSHGFRQVRQALVEAQAQVDAEAAAVVQVAKDRC